MRARGCARAKSGGQASRISRELGCNNYYLSRPFAHPPSPARHYISSRRSMSVDWNGVPEQQQQQRQHHHTASPPPIPPRCASQIELISGIYRAADFPFVLPCAADRVHGRLAVYRYRPGVYPYNTRASHIRAYDRPRPAYSNKYLANNKSARWCASRALRICGIQPRAKSRVAESRGRVRGFFAAIDRGDFEQRIASETNFRAIICVHADCSLRATD